MPENTALNHEILGYPIFRVLSRGPRTSVARKSILDPKKDPVGTPSKTWQNMQKQMSV
jgi:hypothetical protein